MNSRHQTIQLISSILGSVSSRKRASVPLSLRPCRPRRTIFERVPLLLLLCGFADGGFGQTQQMTVDVYSEDDGHSNCTNFDGSNTACANRPGRQPFSPWWHVVRMCIVVFFLIALFCLSNKS